MRASLCITIWLFTAFGSYCGAEYDNITSLPSERRYDNSDFVDNNGSTHETICGMSKGEWMYPPKCIGYGCDYKVTWEYIDDSDEIMFTVSTKNRNKWTGIGFSTNKEMPETDAILGLVEESGRFFMMDTWLRAYEAPPLDQEQNISNMTAWRENGITTLRFFRKRLTGDAKDFQFTDTNCPYLVFPVMGGLFNAVNKRIRKHEITPIISENKVCIRSCKPPSITTPTPESSTSEPEIKPSLEPETDDDEDDEDDDAKKSFESTDKSRPLPDDGLTSVISEDLNAVEHSYNVELKLPGAWKPSLGQRTSSDYKTLQNDVHKQMETELSKNFPALKKLQVMELTGVQGESNSVIARMEVTVLEIPNQKGESDKHATPSLLAAALFAAIQDENLGNLHVDPKYLMITRSDESAIKDESDASVDNDIKHFFGILSEDEVKWAIIIVGVTALIILVIIQACFMICARKNKEKRTPKDNKQIPNSHWKDYAAATASSAYSYENFAANDDPDGSMKPHIAGNGHTHNVKQNLKQQSGGKQYSNNKNLNENNKMPPYQGYSATLERNPQSHSHRNHGYSSAYATHDRTKEPYYRHHHVHPSYSHSLQPDFYFMPHQRRYSGEVVRVFVDYNNPQYIPK